jgi:hypothetical protein
LFGFLIRLDNSKPLPSFSLDYNCLDVAFDLSIKLDPDIADLGKVQPAMILIYLEA